MRLLAAVLSLFVAGCGATDIRLINRSDVPLENVMVEFPSGVEDYGTIPPGGVTDYHEVGCAYSYAYIEATINGQPAVLQPIDYVGEKLLGSGKFTYVLTYNSDAESKYDRMRLELVRD